jgi:riboflavin kinase/FMN adenylyltransferase
MVVATGFFDGVHLGHRHIIQTLIDEARRRKTQSLIITFWPHPRNVLQNGARDLRLLTSLQEKKEKLLSLGVDRVEVLDFSKTFSGMTMQEYVEQILVGKYKAECLVLGYDNRMGRDCQEPQQILPIAQAAGADVVFAEAVYMDNQAVSSTRVRKAIASGEVGEAAKMLGENYSLHGVVVAGKRLGRTLGYPTANMQLYDPLKAIPAPGVYAVQVQTLGGVFGGMCNIGYRPTVASGGGLTIETHILDFNEDIYGLDMRLSFVSRIREEVRFSSLAELSEQLGKDKQRAMDILKENKIQ